MSTPAFTPATEQAFRQSASVIRGVQESEHQWFAQGDPLSHTLPWMPFQPADFLALLFECVPEMKGRDFLDVGCGPGTKMRLASHFFGLHACGIEIDQPMADHAKKFGDVWAANALDMPAGTYAGWDLIWLYRPFRDPDMEAMLEQRIISEMKPGAILAGASWETDPASLRWHTVFDDTLIAPNGQQVSARGAWMKPRFRPTLML